MDNLRSVLSIVLSKIPSNEILNGKISYNHMSKETFVKLTGYYVKNYSNDELENMYDYMQNEYEEQADYVRGYPIQGDGMHRESFSIFDAILIFSSRTLEEEDGEPVCRYDQLLRWRMTSHELDEEVFATAYLAFRDVRCFENKRSFLWRPVIRHNNIYLNKILLQGMADNHFHLKGSAPQFPLSWISMMNRVTSKRFRKLLDQYGQKRLSTIYYTGTNEGHLYISYLKAALIRCYLFSRLMGLDFVLPSISGERDDYYPQREQAPNTANQIQQWLYESDEILFHRNDIQDNIDNFRSLGEKMALDYALSGNYIHSDPNNVNYILSGERWFMYTMFQKIYSKDEHFERYFNMFYAYLVIKASIRSELVQTNSTMGFDNFTQYQDRKEDFIEDTPFEKFYIRMALKGTLSDQHILALEARISPRDTAKDNAAYIRKVDRIFDKDSDIRNTFFYVFHFIKEKDSPLLLESNLFCRHHKKRTHLKKQAQAIAGMRERYFHEARRLKGIDACSTEIGCRPEVFAQTYRYLKNHAVYHQEEVESIRRPEDRICQLSLTYHVGEDYLDIVDGLRAINEAVKFLHMDCGSRLGHALALGVNVEEYYRIKKHKILISQQDYLDNLVWIYYKIKKFGLKNYETLLTHIEQEYSKYFRLIYGNHISDESFHAILKEARIFFKCRDSKVAEDYRNSTFHFRLPEYYAAWKLRGDNPQCYIDGYFKELESFSEWDENAVNREYPLDYRSRYNPECAYLYFLYHFCGGAKKEGAKIIEINVGHQLVRCVQELQREMRFWISRRGIGIETNPSSNYLIGPFRRYDKHPIFDFYNLGLTVDPQKLAECPQIPVCVNTDDQGIFSTYLENEYALLALALEKAKDETGKYQYNRMLIYQWIDQVRQLGINLSFAAPIPLSRSEKPFPGIYSYKP